MSGLNISEGLNFSDYSKALDADCNLVSLDTIDKIDLADLKSGNGLFGADSEDKNSFHNNMSAVPNENSDLRLALEKQKVLNKQLERELMLNKMQQQMLKKKLYKERTSPRASFATNVIENIVSPPLSHTSVTGSPMRRTPRLDPEDFTPNDLYGIQESLLKQDFSNPHDHPLMSGSASSSKAPKKNWYQLISPALSYDEPFNTDYADHLFEGVLSPQEEVMGLGIQYNSNMDSGEIFPPDHKVPSKGPGLSLESPNKIIPPPAFFTMDNENARRRSITTPILGPPEVESFIDAFESPQFELEDTNCDSDEEYNNRTALSTMASPVLKHQSDLRECSPNMGLQSPSRDSTQDASPIKITKKPTTLPRGSIDIYVKELPEKLFECIYPECGKIFKRRYNIRSHIQTHLEDRPYACEHEGCNKMFVRNHDLIRHKKIHAEKSCVCPCGKKFNREDALIVHRSRMICSGGKKYDNVVIKRSPRKRGRPRKDGQDSVSSSPVKMASERETQKYLIGKLERQISANGGNCKLFCDDA